jgi:predicted CoA-binding protein
MTHKGRMLTDAAGLGEALRTCRTIAIVGLSSNPVRDSYDVARYLQQNGYRILPVNPGEKEILGERVFRSLDEIESPVDMIDVFRRPEAVLSHAHEAVRLKPKVFWMQLGIVNQAAADILTAGGIHVVMNKCTKTEHARLISQHSA